MTDTKPLSRRTALVGGLALLGIAALPYAAMAQGLGPAHDFTFEGLDGAPLPLSQFAGGPILVVNTASFCGFTRQYEGLQALHARYSDAGLTVVGVPSNDFGRQEPGTAGEIEEFCTGIYGVQFPLAMKQVVRGPRAHPFYQWARAELGPDQAPRWNFHKYLIAPDGRLVAAFPSQVRPQSGQIVDAIEALLPGNTG